MKRVVLIIVLLLGFASLFAQDVLPRPNPPMLVNDEAHVLSGYDRNTLEQKLVDLDNSSTNQIVILTIPTLGDNDIEGYANKLFRSWQIGDKKNNNGVLILVAINDRKVRIEVGYGLEGAIPDVTANDIISNDIAPAFKQGNYYSGLNSAVESLSKAAIGEYHERRKGGGSKGGGGGSIFGAFIVLFIILMIAARGGRGGGGGGGGFLTGAILGSMLNSGSRSSGWSGGSGWGGGGGGGGFGGFGGGSSGGGGASGGW